MKLAAVIEARPARPSRALRAGELATLLRDNGLRNDGLMMTLAAARAELKAGNLTAAGQRLGRVRPAASTPLAVRLRAREVRAELAEASGRRAPALQHVRRGLDELHDWQSRFGSLDLQSSMVGHGRRLALEGLRLALADARPEVVFEWTERARALASRVTPVRPPSDPAAARALAELRQAPDEATAAGLRSRIRQRSWYGEGSGQVARPAALDDLEAVLSASRGILASYLVVDEELHCLVVGTDRREVVRLGAAGPGPGTAGRHAG